MNLHNDPYTKASLSSDAARRQDFGFLSKPKEEQDAWWAEQTKISEMRRRAQQAYRSGKPAPKRRRNFRESPTMSRQYVTVATMAFRDGRLNKTTACLIAEAVALAGTTGYTDATNAEFAKLLNRSPSTVKRCYAEAVEYGYFTSELIHTHTGAVKRRRTRPTDLAWPYWHPMRQNPQEACQPINAPDSTTPLKGSSMEKPSDTNDKEFLRMILAIHPQVAMLAEESGVSIAEAVESSIRLIAAGRLRLEDGPEGSRLVPLDARGKPPPTLKPKKRRLFRP